MRLYDVDAFETAVENYKRARSSCESEGLYVPQSLEIRDWAVVHLFDVEFATDLLYDLLGES